MKCLFMKTDTESDLYRKKIGKSVYKVTYPISNLEERKKVNKQKNLKFMKI